MMGKIICLVAFQHETILQKGVWREVWWKWCLCDICPAQVQIKAFSFCSNHPVLPQKVQFGQKDVKCKSFRKSSIWEGAGGAKSDGGSGRVIIFLGGGFKDLLFSPRNLGKWSNLTICFFRWVGSTTNQILCQWEWESFISWVQIWALLRHENQWKNPMSENVVFQVSHTRWSPTSYKWRLRGPYNWL